MKGPGKCGHFLQLLEQSPTDEAKAIEVDPLESEAGVRRQGGDRATSPRDPGGAAASLQLLEGPWLVQQDSDVHPAASLCVCPQS